MPTRRPFWSFPEAAWSRESRARRGPIQKNEVVFFAAKDYYQITNTGTEPLVLFGNRSESFGGPHIKADGTDRNARV